MKGDSQVVSKIRGIIAFSVLSLVLCSVLGSSVIAAESKVGAFGTIDIEKTFNDYNKKKQLDQELIAYADLLKLKLDERKNNRLLSADDSNLLMSLMSKSAQTPADKAKIDELRNTSKQLEVELQGLQQKSSPTDVEKARLNELQARANALDETLKADQSKYEADFAAKRADMSKQVMQEIEVVVAAMAKDKGLSIVFNKTYGELGLIVYSNVDITDEVITKLNKK